MFEIKGQAENFLKKMLDYRRRYLIYRNAKEKYNIHIRNFRGISYLYRYVPASKLDDASDKEKSLMASFRRFQRGDQKEYKRYLALYYKYITEFMWMKKIDGAVYLTCVPSSSGERNRVEDITDDLADMDLFSRTIIFDGRGLLKWNRKRKPVSKGNYYTVEENIKMLEVTRELPEKTVIVLDDVVNSGNTAHACIRKLKEAGADQVYVLCIFSCRTK